MAITISNVIKAATLLAAIKKLLPKKQYKKPPSKVVDRSHFNTMQKEYIVKRYAELANSYVDGKKITQKEIAKRLNSELGTNKSPSVFLRISKQAIKAVTNEIL